MHRIDCPWCGLRDETEFQYQGDASLAAFSAAETLNEQIEYVYFRDNPKGLHQEYWHHVGGCRQYIIATRDTVTHHISEIRLARSSAQKGVT